MFNRFPVASTSSDSVQTRGDRVKSTVTSLLAWLVVLGAWDLTARIDNAIADTHEPRDASILRELSNPQEIDYEAMHEHGGGRREPCLVSQRVLDR